nr:hypothetical protein [Lysinibacillus timonensis]
MHNNKFMLIQNGYEYQVPIMNYQNFKYKVIVNYKGFNQHFAMWFSDELDEAIYKAIEELHIEFPFEQIAFKYD